MSNSKIWHDDITKGGSVIRYCEGYPVEYAADSIMPYVEDLFWLFLDAYWHIFSLKHILDMGYNSFCIEKFIFWLVGFGIYNLYLCFTLSKLKFLFGRLKFDHMYVGRQFVTLLVYNYIITNTLKLLSEYSMNTYAWEYAEYVLLVPKEQLFLTFGIVVFLLILVALSAIENFIIKGDDDVVAPILLVRAVLCVYQWVMSVLSKGISQEEEKSYE